MTATLLAVCMATLAMITLPNLDDPNAWSQWGLAGAVVGYTLWRARQMKAEQQTRENWIRDTMLTAIQRNTAALEKVESRLE